jgi:hypothetical protein
MRRTVGRGQIIIDKFMPIQPSFPDFFLEEKSEENLLKTLSIGEFLHYLRPTSIIQQENPHINFRDLQKGLFNTAKKAN